MLIPALVAAGDELDGGSNDLDQRQVRVCLLLRGARESGEHRRQLVMPLGRTGGVAKDSPLIHSELVVTVPGG
jgi:hypothetical protein